MSGQKRTASLAPEDEPAAKKHCSTSGIIMSGLDPKSTEDLPATLLYASTDELERFLEEGPGDRLSRCLAILTHSTNRASFFAQKRRTDFDTAFVKFVDGSASTDAQSFRGPVGVTHESVSIMKELVSVPLLQVHIHDFSELLDALIAKQNTKPVWPDLLVSTDGDQKYKITDDASLVTYILIQCVYENNIRLFNHLLDVFCESDDTSFFQRLGCIEDAEIEIQKGDYVSSMYAHCMINGHATFVESMCKSCRSLIIEEPIQVEAFEKNHVRCVTAVLAADDDDEPTLVFGDVTHNAFELIGKCRSVEMIRIIENSRGVLFKDINIILSVLMLQADGHLHILNDVKLEFNGDLDVHTIKDFMKDRMMAEFPDGFVEWINKCDSLSASAREKIFVSMMNNCPVRWRATKIGSLVWLLGQPKDKLKFEDPATVIYLFLYDVVWLKAITLDVQHLSFDDPVTKTVNALIKQFKTGRRNVNDIADSCRWIWTSMNKKNVQLVAYFLVCEWLERDMDSNLKQFTKSSVQQLMPLL